MINIDNISVEKNISIFELKGLNPLRLIIGTDYASIF